MDLAEALEVLLAAASVEVLEAEASEVVVLLEDGNPYIHFVIARRFYDIVICLFLVSIHEITKLFVPCNDCDL